MEMVEVSGDIADRMGSLIMKGVACILNVEIHVAGPSKYHGGSVFDPRLVGPRDRHELMVHVADFTRDVLAVTEEARSKEVANVVSLPYYYRTG